MTQVQAAEQHAGQQRGTQDCGGAVAASVNPCRLGADPVQGAFEDRIAHVTPVRFGPWKPSGDGLRWWFISCS